MRNTQFVPTKSSKKEKLLKSQYNFDSMASELSIKRPQAKKKLSKNLKVPSIENKQKIYREKLSQNAVFSNRKKKRSLINTNSTDSIEKKLPFLNEWSDVSITGKNDVVLQGSPPRLTQDIFIPDLYTIKPIQNVKKSLKIASEKKK
jgi:hypothetical protein